MGKIEHPQQPDSGSANEDNPKRNYQEVLKEGLSRRISNGLDIQAYILLASEETINVLKQNQEAIKEGLSRRISKGWDIQAYVLLASEEVLKELFENKESLKHLTEKAVQSFFKSGFNLEKDISELVSNKRKEELERILFDKTLLPIGIKIHTKENSSVSSFLKRTGGFAAHGHETCFVANPVANASVLELCLEVLNKRMEKDGLAFDKDTYFQTCIPEKLNNEMCGIATIAFLFSRKKTLQYNENLIRHNQNTIGVTIYDAGSVVIGQHFVPTKGEYKGSPAFNGRTDMLLCGELEDIKTAQLILSLLVHASYQKQELKHRELGQNFINEFKAILAKRNHSDWMKNKFVDLAGGDVKGLGEVLLAITKRRNEMNEYVNNYNRGVKYLKTEDNWDDNIYRDLAKLKENIDNSIVFEIKALVEKYRELVYPEGKYIDERAYGNAGR